MQEAQKTAEKPISERKHDIDSPSADTAVSDMHSLLAAVQPNAIAQRKMQDQANRQGIQRSGAYQLMANNAQRAVPVAPLAKQDPQNNSTGQQPVQRTKTDIYSHTGSDMRRIKAAADKAGVGGLCHAWTVDWVKKKAAGENVAAKYTDPELEALAKEQKKYYKDTNLEAPNSLEGFNLEAVATGRMAYHNPLDEIGGVAVTPDTGYYLSMGESNLGEDSQGHAIAVYVERAGITVMDQNKGQFTLSNMGELATEYTTFVQEMQDDHNIKLREWRLYKMTPKPAKKASRLPCFLTTACVVCRDLPDDCEELTVLRKFRDEYVLLQKNGAELLNFYYFYSPRIVSKLNTHKHSRRLYDQLYLVIRYCVNLIKKDEWQNAMEAYIEMCLVLQKKFVAPDLRADPARLEKLLYSSA